jgi:hypothetical protein
MARGRPKKIKEEPESYSAIAPSGFPVAWIVVRFRDGIVYKIPATIIADKISQEQKIPLQEVITNPNLLVEYCSNISWLTIQPYAQKQHSSPINYINDWPGIEKEVEYASETGEFRKF